MAAPSKRTSGTYVKQPAGYKAFIPKDLPLIPPLVRDDEMWQLLQDATIALGRLDGCTRILPDPDLFVYMYIRKEAVLSSQIEGTQASLQDVLQFEEKLSDPDNDTEEVLNHITAMNYGLERLSKRPMSLRLIREIHAKLMAGVRGSEKTPGDFRTSQNWIGPHGSTLQTATFIPPPPPEMHAALSNLEKFVHDSSEPSLIRAGIAHAQFETIHPFLDGNGRLGRLLITFLLCQSGILTRPLLYLSHYFKENKAQYFEVLQATRDFGEWERWVKFFLLGVAQVADEAGHTAIKITELRERHRKLITTRRRNTASSQQLLEHLYTRPIVDVKSVANVTGLSYQNANALVKRFCDLKILEEYTGGGRNRRFAYGSYLTLL